MAGIAAADAIDMTSYPTVFSTETLHRKGLCPVTTLAHKKAQEGHSVADKVLPEEHSLYYEIHGNGPQKVVLIMGLNANSFSWRMILERLIAVKEADGSYQYSILVFDNRGVGNSGTPRGPYSTSGMADDVSLLLDYVGWTGTKSLHVVGVSMGGMIALELASREHDRIISLTLLVTTAGGFSFDGTTPFKGVAGLTKLVFTPSVEDKIKISLPLLYPESWLQEPAVDYDRPDITNYEYLVPDFRRRITSSRPQKLMGALSQAWAALMHSVSVDRLRTIDRNIGKIYIATGDDDLLVRPVNSFKLKRHIPSAEFEQFKNTGHGIITQRQKQISERLQRVFAEGVAALEGAQ